MGRFPLLMGHLPEYLNGPSSLFKIPWKQPMKKRPIKRFLNLGPTRISSLIICPRIGSQQFCTKGCMLRAVPLTIHPNGIDVRKIVFRLPLTPKFSQYKTIFVRNEVAKITNLALKLSALYRAIGNCDCDRYRGPCYRAIALFICKGGLCLAQSSSGPPGNNPQSNVDVGDCVRPNVLSCVVLSASM